MAQINPKYLQTESLCLTNPNSANTIQPLERKVWQKYLLDEQSEGPIYKVNTSKSHSYSGGIIIQWNECTSH